jgi:nucleoside-diphosphate-sugar epimerase
MSGFVDVQDVVKAMITIMQSSFAGERFIISGSNVYYKDVFVMMAKYFHKKVAHKKVTPFLANIVWRLEALKSTFTGKDPLLTKETAKTAQACVRFNNTKLLEYFPDFEYTDLEKSIQRICEELKLKYNLP